MVPEASAAITDRHRHVVEQLERTLELARDPVRLAHREPEISQWSVGQQLEHVLNVHRSVVDVLDRLAAGEGDPAGRPKAAGRLFLSLGWIPRGRATAPERVRPRGIDAGALTADLEGEKRRFLELDLAALDGAAGTFPHQVFGPLTARRWLRFLEIHNHHHWKIVRDILRRDSGPETAAEDGGSRG